MPEHRIALRLAWDGEGAGTSRRIDLPATWQAGEVPDRLARGFRRPPRIAHDAEVFLEIAEAPGLTSARLDELDLGPILGGATLRFAVPRRIGMLRLVLELDATSVPLGVTWGHVALVIPS